MIYSVTTIGVDAFSDCTDQTSVTIGNSVTSIVYRAFNSCDALQTVKCMGTVPPAMSSSS